MKTAVWDTYVKKQDGNVMHFDILVPDTMKDAAQIHEYGKQYLLSKNETAAKLDTEECRFCHIEEATGEMKESIAVQGYFIIEMDEISAQLPAEPSRRDLILHLRAHYPEYRFADFRNKTSEEIEQMIRKI